MSNFTGEENEILQNECLKLKRRIEKLQYKHDYYDLSSWDLNVVNLKISALTKILDILERAI